MKSSRFDKETGAVALSGRAALGVVEGVSK